MRITLCTVTFMSTAHQLRGSKKATNLSISSDLLSKAKKHNINLSATLERALVKELQLKQRAQWLEENRQAIVAYNEHVENHGVFSDSSREF